VRLEHSIETGSAGGGTRAYLTVFGAPPSPVTVTGFEPSLGRRVGRALVALLVCWGLAAVSVPIVLAHFILVPGFFAAGLVLAYLRFRTARVVTRIHGACPRCGVEQDFQPPRWGRKVDCPRCKNQLTLEESPGDAAPVSGGSMPASRAGG
jgi:hypothetical protein